MATFDGAVHAFISFQSVQPACRACELLDGQQVPVLTGQRPLIIKFRPLAIGARMLRPASSANGCSWNTLLPTTRTQPHSTTSQQLASGILGKLDH